MAKKLLAVALVALAALLATACGKGDHQAGPKPGTTVTVPGDTSTSSAATSTTRPGATTTTAPGRPRDTTTAPPTEINGGSARIYGTVFGPSGPLAGANIRVERFTGTQVATANLTAATGGYNLPNVRGGSYRVTAWRAPDLFLSEPTAFFLGADESKVVDLRLTKVSDVNVTATADPDPLPPTDPFTLTVQVYAGTVTDQGVLQGASRPDVAVQLVGASGIALVGQPTGTTDAFGKVAFHARCLQPGQPTADVMLLSLRFPLTLPKCPG